MKVFGEVQCHAHLMIRKPSRLELYKFTNHINLGHVERLNTFTIGTPRINACIVRSTDFKESNRRSTPSSHSFRCVSNTIGVRLGDDVLDELDSATPCERGVDTGKETDFERVCGGLENARGDYTIK